MKIQSDKLVLKIINVNIGQPSRLKSRGREIVSGICKLPISTPVYVAKSGIVGDSVLNTKHHGGPDQAVYGYRVEDYHWCEKERVTPLRRAFLAKT